MELRIEGSDERAELRPGVVIREQHRYGRERRVEFIDAHEGGYVLCVGVASCRRSAIRRATVAKRYKIVRRGA